MNFSYTTRKISPQSILPRAKKETMARFIVFVIASLLLIYSLHYSDGGRRGASYKRLYATIFNAYDNKKAAALHYALLTGDKSRLGKKTRDAFAKLFLLHFLTPSGLHLGFIISILCLFSRKLLWITPVLFFFEGFYAAKRVLILFYLNRLKFGGVGIFFAFFFLDFLFGSFSKNPLSFSLSFLFLGVIYTKRPYKSLLFSFLGAQVLVSFFLDQVFSLTGFLLGFLLTPLLILSFPLYFTGFHMGTKALSLFTVGVIEKLSTLAHYDATFVSVNLILILFLLVFPYSFKGKIPIMACLLATHSNPIINLRSKDHLVTYPPIPISKWVSLKKTQTGYRTTHEDGSLCYFRLRNFSYETDCRNP